LGLCGARFCIFEADIFSMPIYRFRATLEEHDEVYRDVDIRPSQTFEQLAAVLEVSLRLEGPVVGTFFLSDDYYRKGKPIPPTIRTRKGEELITEILDFVEAPHQRFLLELETAAGILHPLQLELLRIIKEEDKKISYPACVRSMGQLPKPIRKNAPPPVVDEEDLKASESFFEQLGSDDQEAYQEEVLVGDLDEEDDSVKGNLAGEEGEEEEKEEEEVEAQEDDDPFGGLGHGDADED
jgi:hypothetical protein